MNPKQFGRYEIKTEVGRGGMATVYRAYDPRFERDVAIKILPPAFQHDAQFRVRFEREAKTIALLEHPAIVPVYDFGEEGEQPYIVMRYMSGGSLSLRLKEGLLTMEETLQIISRLAPSLDAAHARGIIHRDIKPGNILFDQYGNAFLSDFGIARLTEHAGTTITGDSIVGTPAYMSPEQVHAEKELDGRSDIYSLGIILFQMLTGRLPYHSDTPTSTMMMHVLDPIPSVLEINPDLPQGCEEVIINSLAKKPEDRFSTANEMALALEAALKGEPLPTAQTQTPITASVDPTTMVKQPATVPASTLPQAPKTLLPTTKKRSRFATIILGFIVLAGIIAVTIGGSIYLRNQGSSPPAILANTTDSITSTSTATQQPSPSIGLTETAAVIAAELELASQTVAPTITSTFTQEPILTATSSPTITPTPEPAIPVIGGADKIALMRANDIWIANVDGTELTQITNDGQDRSNLQWSPDGESLIYISGKCAWAVNITSGRIDYLACFEIADYFDAFEVSPSGEYVAISMNRELFIVPYNLEQLSEVKYRTDLIEMAECEVFAPYTRGGSAVSVKGVQWSDDEQKLAISKLGVVDGRQEDLIHILNISECIETPPRLDEFPSRRFQFYADDTRSILQSFAWDGQYLFALFNYKRNGGFGDLWIYNTDLHRADKINPIDDKCCYRDPYWSPDGRHLIFAYQDQALGTEAITKLYYVPFGTIGTGFNYAPLPLPEGFFDDPRPKPQPVLRPSR